MSELARLESHVRSGILCAAIAGEIDMSNALDLETRLNEATGDLPAVVIDLTEVTFLDSSGVRLLDHLVAARQPDVALRVVVPGSGPVPFTLRLCDFPKELLVDSVEAGLAALRD